MASLTTKGLGKFNKYTENSNLNREDEIAGEIDIQEDESLNEGTLEAVSEAVRKFYFKIKDRKLRK